MVDHDHTPKGCATHTCLSGLLSTPTTALGKLIGDCNKLIMCHPSHQLDYPPPMWSCNQDESQHGSRSCNNTYALFVNLARIPGALTQLKQQECEWQKLPSDVECPAGKKNTT